MYPTELVMPMKAQLTDHGFTDAHTPEIVNHTLSQEGLTLLVVNSVCGCAAGSCRPGVLKSLQVTDIKPQHLVTVFAGYDTDAVKTAREHLMPFPPSSPAIALFKDGELVHMLERHHIEGHTAEVIAENLKAAYLDFSA